MKGKALMKHSMHEKTAASVHKPRLQVNQTLLLVRVMRMLFLLSIHYVLRLFIIFKLPDFIVLKS